MSQQDQKFQLPEDLKEKGHNPHVMFCLEELTEDAITLQAVPQNCIM